MKLSAENKINVKNAFNLGLIDYMAEMVRKKAPGMDNFQVGSENSDYSRRWKQQFGFVLNKLNPKSFMIIIVKVFWRNFSDFCDKHKLVRLVNIRSFSSSLYSFGDIIQTHDPELLLLPSKMQPQSNNSIRLNETCWLNDDLFNYNYLA